MTHPLFEHVDPAELAFATLQLGRGYVEGAFPVMSAFAVDPDISPDLLKAAIVNAHLSGAAAALFGMSGDAEGDEHLAEQARDFLLVTIGEMREHAAAAGLDSNYTPRCSSGDGHRWVVSDENDNVSYCENCGADGNA